MDTSKKPLASKQVPYKDEEEEDEDEFDKEFETIVKKQQEREHVASKAKMAVRASSTNQPPNSTKVEPAQLNKVEHRSEARRPSPQP